MSRNVVMDGGIAMLLNDRGIAELIGTVLQNADASRVGAVSYDVQTKYFVDASSRHMLSCNLAPGDSVFVATEETIALPSDLAARVLLKNSRIRQGLTLDAPLYFPGHKTRIFFRVTNVSGDIISLDTEHDIAQITFERLEQAVERPYEGAFSDEMDYSGMGTYSEIYSSQLRHLDSKAEEIKGIEKRMYSNVMAIMAVFAAIFTLVNVNVAATELALKSVLVMNLVTVGSFALLVALISFAVGEQRSHKRAIACAAISLVCFAVAIACAALLS